MADKNEIIKRKLAERAALRRQKAQEEKWFLDHNLSSQSGFRVQTKGPGEARAGYSGEFLVGPLRGGEARTYSRAKGAVAKKKK